MALILRRKPLSAQPVPSLVRRRSIPSTVAAQTTENPPKRQLRFATSTNAATRAQAAASARADIDELLKSVANEEHALDEASANLERLHAQIEERLRGANINNHSDGHYKTEIVESFSRQSRTIDPKKFRNAVSNDDFWGCLKVGVTEATKVLSEKELDAISDVVPPKSMGYVFKIKKIERKSK